MSFAEAGLHIVREYSGSAYCTKFQRVQTPAMAAAAADKAAGRRRRQKYVAPSPAVVSLVGLATWLMGGGGSCP